MTFQQKIKKFFSQWDARMYVYVLAGVVGATAFGLSIMLGFGVFGSDNDARPIPVVLQEVSPEPSCPLRRVLDGVCVLTLPEVNPRLVAIMVENHFDSWPQDGLSEARVVYEAPVEANITRFLAIYNEQQEVKKVGPVRSARPYYLDWVSEYGSPMYMHVGGSPDALAVVADRGMFDVNEFYRGWYFWRSRDRYAPHNTYTSQELWHEAWEEHGARFSSSTFSVWLFSPAAPTTTERAMTITASFDPPTYEAVWKFNSSTGQYERFQMREAHADAAGTQIVADTIVVQRVKSVAIDEVGRRDVDTLGSGEVMVFRDGLVITGEWRKKDVGDRTRFFDEDGNEIALKPGKIWIEVVGLDGSVAYQ